MVSSTAGRRGGRIGRSAGLAAVGAIALLALAGTAQASDGTWERAWGKDVDSAQAGTGFEICTVAANCKRGEFAGLGGELNSPHGLATDANGNVYVAEMFNHRVSKFDSSGTWERTWGKDVIQEDKPGDTDPPGGAPDGFEICTVAADCKVGVAGFSGGELQTPVAVATDASGNVYVAEQGNNRVSKFNSLGAWERTWGGGVDTSQAGTGFEVCTVAASCTQGGGAGLGGEMQLPSGIATDGAGNVYVSDRNFHRIHKFSSLGTWERAWGKDVIQSGEPGDLGTGFEVCTVAADCKAGTVGTLGGELEIPDEIAADSTGTVYVADAGNIRIQKFDSSGTWERAWGKDVIQSGVTGDTGTGFEVCTVAANCKADAFGGLGGEMASPIGVATDGAKVYVADPGNRRIEKFDSSGTWERAWGKDVIQGGEAGDLGGVFEVCTVAADCQAGSSGALGGEFAGGDPTAVALDAAESLYVAQFNDHRIQKFIEGTAPAVPTITDTDPDSPANDNVPEVKGTTGAGSPTTVRIYENNSTCTGTPDATGTVAQFTGSGITVNVPDNSTTDLRATTVNVAGDESACSAPLTYVEDSNSPPAPTITDTDPDSPANDNDPEVKGTAEAGSTVKVFSTSDCSGTPLATGSASTFSSPGITVSVADNSTTNLRATATDQAGNASPCSAPFTYVEDSSPPPGGGGEPSPTTGTCDDLTLGKAKRNKEKGTAKLTAQVPCAGSVEIAGKTVKGAEKQAPAAGEVKLPVKPKGKAKRKLNDDGKAKVRVEVIFTPTGGAPVAEDAKLKLVKK
jgi:hypothetical protein